MQHFDVIIVGGGHAGAEAAAASSRAGASTALVTFDASTLGAMSCNPAIGGLGKGHLVREVDAFDGLLGRAADAGAIHYRMLNRSKGSAVHGPRVQADRKRFRAAVQAMLSRQENLTVVEGEAAELLRALAARGGGATRANIVAAGERHHNRAHRLSEAGSCMCTYMLVCLCKRACMHTCASNRCDAASACIVINHDMRCMHVK